MILLIYGFSISCNYLLPAEYNEKPGTRFFKWEDALNTHFSKAIQIANGHVKCCSRSLIIRDMQIITTTRRHLTPVRMTITTKSASNKCGWGCGERGSLLHPTLLMGRWIGAATVENSMEVSQRNKNRPIMTRQFYSCVYSPKNPKC